MPCRTLSPARRLATRFGRDGRGVAAVEFALIMPALLVLYLSAAGIADGVTANRKLRTTAATTADLVGKLKTTTAAEVRATLQISAMTMEPKASADTKLRVSSVTIDANGHATVDWSVAINGATKLVAGSVYAELPTSFAQQRGRSLIAVRADYAYHPLSAYELDAVYNMSETQYVTARELPGALPCADCAGS